MKARFNFIPVCLLCAALLQAVTGGAQPAVSDVTAVAAGGFHSLFLKNDGSLWVMGFNGHGQLGDGTVSDTNVPEQTVSSNVTAIAGGLYHDLFLKNDGSLWAVGEDYYGQLGDGFYDDFFPPYGTVIPEEIVSNNVTAIAAGGDFSLFLKSDGSLWGMGGNTYGQLGFGTNVSYTNLPGQIVASNVTAIAARGEHSLFLKSDGSLWGMGWNAYGQLGDGTTNNVFIPEMIVSNNVTAIASGYYHSMFLKSGGSLWAMGGDTYGQLGDGKTTPNAPFGILTPQKIVSDSVRMIAGGGLHSLFIKSDGSLWAVGFNTYDELGDGKLTNPKQPEKIITSHVTAIAAGNYHSLFIKSDGSLWAMGDNQNGQLGDGTLGIPNLPEEIVMPETGAFGALKVTLTPVDVVKPGAQWQLDGGAFQNSGILITNLAVGSHTVSFKPIAGWITPSNQTVAIKVGLTTPVVGFYTAIDVTRPTLAITAPTSKHNVSNAVFTVTGTASDNFAVSNVLYSFNGGDWTNASPVNASWINWTAQIDLILKSNTISVYAVDASGNLSITNTVKFIYILSAAPTVHTNGSGTISPNYNGTLLQLGANYSMTAKAGKGFGFVNWTDGDGNVLTNKTALHFTMVSNLTFLANFVDVTKPKSSITSPKANQKLTNAVLTVTGKASDNVAVTNVWVQLNSDNWTNAMTGSGWTNWNVTLNLNAGANTVRAYAVDSVGNNSPTNSVKFTYTPPPASAAANVSVIQQPPLQFDCSSGNIVMTNGCLQMQLDGPAGTVVVESSTDLIKWTPIQTNTVPAGGLPLVLPMNQQPMQFFRARQQQPQQ